MAFRVMGVVVWVMVVVSTWTWCAVATDVAQHGDPDIHVGRVVGVGDRIVWDDFNKLDHRLSPS